MKIKRKSIFSSLTIAFLVGLSGCGGSGDSEPTKSGVGYYVDSPVIGVDYTCGDIRDKTGEKGEFFFQKGKSCTFHLGELVLESVDGEKLTDGVVVKVQKVEVAQLLQSLDKDANADNGIEILPEVVEIVEKELPTLPESATELEEILKEVVEKAEEEVPEYDGKYVPLEEAIKHLDTTPPTIMLNGDAEITLTAGETYQEPGVNVSDDYTPVDQIKIEMDSLEDTTQVGDHQLRYTATDLAGNSASVVRIVHIVPKEDNGDEDTEENVTDGDDSDDNVSTGGDSEDNVTDSGDDSDENATDSDDSDENATTGGEDSDENATDSGDDSDDNVSTGGDDEDNATTGDENTEENATDGDEDSDENATDGDDSDENATDSGEDSDENATAGDDTEDNATDGDDSDDNVSTGGDSEDNVTDNGDDSDENATDDGSDENTTDSGEDSDENATAGDDTEDNATDSETLMTM